MFCTQCGHSNPDGRKICERCGAELGPPIAAPTTPVGASPPGDAPPPPPQYASTPGYGAYTPPPSYPAYPSSPPTNSLAIIALIAGIGGITILPFVASIAAVILGHIALGQIKSSNGPQSGDGMAKVGLVLGYLGVVLPVLLCVCYFLFIVGLVGLGSVTPSTR